MISVIIPVYNERDSIKELCDSIVLFFEGRQEDYEIIIVDDHSSDGSDEIIRSLESGAVSSIRHERNKGVGAARTTGVNAAKGEYVLFTDADMTYKVSDFAQVLDSLDEYDMVVGARQEEKGTVPVLRNFVKKTLFFIASYLTETSIPDLNSGLRAIRREPIKDFFHLLPKGHSWVSTITICFLARSLKVGFVPIEYEKRRGSSSFHVIKDSYGMFLTILRTVMYFYPLRVIMPLSFFSFGLAFLSFLRDIITLDIADTTIFLMLSGVLLFVFALVSQQIAMLRLELLSLKDSGCEKKD